MASRAIGVDPGTMFFQVAEADGGSVRVKNTRNAFVELPTTDDVEETLKTNGWQYIRDGNNYYVVGDDCIKVANIFPGKVEVRRPMADGVLNKNEDKKLVVLAELVKASIGQAPDDKSWVCICVSSESIDSSADSTFHKNRLTALFTRLGWKVKVLEEAHAVVLSERPTMVEEDGTIVPYSGIGVSCLLPHTKIYTKRGILKIEDVKVGDEVITHNGRWKRVSNVISKEFNGINTNLQIVGYSNNTDDYGFVDNHELFVRRNGLWKWIGCEEVLEGDEVGEPILHSNIEDSIPAINLCEKITNSSDYTKRRIEASSDVCRLLGYFLADGSVNRENNEGINFKFSKNETKYIDDVKSILLKNFDKDSSVYEEDGWIRICCYSKGMGNWFRNHCYDNNKEKVFPWDLSRLSYGQCLNLLIGLIRGDGSISNNLISFGNTSSQLVMIAKQCFSRIGYPSSISWSDPRVSKGIDGREITGNKIYWQVSCGQKFAFTSFAEMIENMNCENSKFIQKIRIEDNFCIGKIQKIEYKEYSGIVYDLQVEDDHSFSGPMLTIHNCGAGRTNLVLAYKGLQVAGMSVAIGGDWIDKQVSDQTGVAISQVISAKERKLDFNNLDDNDDVIFALNAYYDAMIERVFKQFGKKFQEVKSQFSQPLDIVVAGGTSMPKGFCQKLEKIVRGLQLPFQIKEVRHAKNPRNAVVEGLLTQAIITQKKDSIPQDPLDKILS